MNKQRLRKKQREEMRKPRGWHKKLQGGYTQKKKKKGKLCKRQLGRQKKMQRKKKKKRKGSWMKSSKDKKLKG